LFNVTVLIIQENGTPYTPVSGEM